MECAICFDVIGAARAALGCGHAFHINCIVSWYYRQNMQCEIEKHEYQTGRTASSCPCCRAVPASKLDDIPNEQLINFIPSSDAEEDDDSETASMALSDEGSEEDEELAAATPRTPTPIPSPLSPLVPPLDFSSLQLRWTRSGPTSWERSIEVTAPAPEPQSWDGARTPSPPPDSLVVQVVAAARKIQAAWRARSSSPPQFV